MKKILGAAAALALLSAPVLAQSPAAPSGANEMKQHQVQPSAPDPSVDSASKGSDANMPTTDPLNSGGSGINDDYGVGIARAPAANTNGGSGGPLAPQPQDRDGK